MSVPRGGDVPPISEEATLRVLGMIPGSTFGRSGQVRRIGENPGAATRSLAPPKAGGGGGAPVAFAAWKLTGAETFGHAVSPYSVVDSFGPYTDYLDYDGVSDVFLVAEGWFQASFFTTISGGTNGAGYYLEGALASWGGVNLHGTVNGGGTGFIGGAGLVTYDAGTDANVANIRVYDLTSGGGGVGANTWMAITVWAP